MCSRVYRYPADNSPLPRYPITRFSIVSPFSTNNLGPSALTYVSHSLNDFLILQLSTDN
jgi:hypothetical protein